MTVIMTGTAPFTLKTILTNKTRAPNLGDTHNLTALPSMEVMEW
jgi:hypothetical protein